jgi:hypothetical protein
MHYAATLKVSGHVSDTAELQRTDAIPFLKKVVPATATDIYYYCHPHSGSGDVSFRLDEGDFLAWTDSQGWKVKAAGPGSFATTVHENEMAVSVSVTNGYWFQGYDPKKHDRYIDLGYDRRTQRVYMYCGRG